MTAGQRAEHDQWLESPLADQLARWRAVEDQVRAVVSGAG